METSAAITARKPWNKGKLVGQKTPLKLKEIWAIRIRLQIASRCRDLALFNLAVDSKLRACDLMQLRDATSATARAWRPVPSTSNRKPADLYSSRLRSRPARRYPRGFPARARSLMFTQQVRVRRTRA
jgi:hypothetical protein